MLALLVHRTAFVNPAAPLAMMAVPNGHGALDRKLRHGSEQSCGCASTSGKALCGCRPHSSAAGYPAQAAAQREVSFQFIPIFSRGAAGGLRALVIRIALLVEPSESLGDVPWFRFGALDRGAVLLSAADDRGRVHALLDQGFEFRLRGLLRIRMWVP